MEQGFDLLDAAHDDSTSMGDLQKVVIMEDDSGNMHLKGLSMNLASTAEEALNLLFVGDTNRAMSETVMNANSSRSHCIFTISIESRRPGSDVIKRSKLNLVDLAGSERTHKTGATGQTLRESKFINTSLHFLEVGLVHCRWLQVWVLFAYDCDSIDLVVLLIFCTILLDCRRFVVVSCCFFCHCHCCWCWVVMHVAVLYTNT